MGMIVPIIAAIGSLLAVIGGIQNPLYIYYLIICVTMLVIAYFYYGRHKDDIHNI